MKLRSVLLLVLLYAAPVFAQPCDLASAQIVDSPGDVGSWTPTATITHVDFSSGRFVVDFDKRTGSGKWPEAQKAGDPDTQYTLGLCLNVGGRWVASGVVQFWSGRNLEAGGDVDDIAGTWFYDGRWGPLQGHQPAKGEPVGIWVGQGNLRGGHGATPVHERSKVLMLPWGTNFSGTVPPPVDPPPVDPPPPNPPAAGAATADLQQQQIALLLRIVAELEAQVEGQKVQSAALESAIRDLKAEIAKGIKVRF